MAEIYSIVELSEGAGGEVYVWEDVMLCRVCWFFFFKQKTAYEIKECDWSSDVCSSVLAPPPVFWPGNASLDRASARV